jgi:hypothetical protein
MNLRRRTSRRAGLGGSKLPAAAIAAAMAIAMAGLVWPAQAQEEAKGYNAEDFGFEMGPVKAKGLVAPAYAQVAGGSLIVSDVAVGAVFSVPVAGGNATAVGKIKKPAGVAIAPDGFGSYGGQIFVLAPEGGDVKAPCAVARVDKSGAVSSFAKLPAAGSLDGGKPSDCRDLEFGAAGGPFASKLYAVTNGNATIYEIDAGGKARALGTYDKPLAWEIHNIGFAPANDSKAPNAMLLSLRPRSETAPKVGRIAIIDPSGKMNDDFYLVGLIRPTGFAFAPEGFGDHTGVLFVADQGKLAADNKGEHDGRVYRLFKGMAREYGTGLVDPTCMKFAGKTMVLCDPAAHGKTNSGALVTISPAY